MNKNAQFERIHKFNNSTIFEIFYDKGLEMNLRMNITHTHRERSEKTKIAQEIDRYLQWVSIKITRRCLWSWEKTTIAKKNHTLRRIICIQWIWFTVMLFNFHLLQTILLNMTVGFRFGIPLHEPFDGCRLYLRTYIHLHTHTRAICCENADVCKFILIFWNGLPAVTYGKQMITKNFKKEHTHKSSHK